MERVSKSQRKIDATRLTELGKSYVGKRVRYKERVYIHERGENVETGKELTGMALSFQGHILSMLVKCDGVAMPIGVPVDDIIETL